jgi:hypothetical protein
MAAGVFAPDLPPPLVAVAMMALGGPGQVMLRVLTRQLPLPAVPAGDALAAALLRILLRGVGSPSAA